MVGGLFIAVASIAEHVLWTCKLEQFWHTGSVVVACRPPEHSGFSSCSTRAVEHRFSRVVAHGHSFPMDVESFQTRDQTWVSCIGRWVLIQCTTREVLHISLLVKKAFSKGLPASCSSLRPQQIGLLIHALAVTEARKRTFWHFQLLRYRQAVPAREKVVEGKIVKLVANSFCHIYH